MRYVLWFWALPLGFFWGWYFLSANDIALGTIFFSRTMHDLVFTIYGNLLGLDPAKIPGMVAEACVFDSAVIFGLIAFRRRRQLAARFLTVRERYLAPRIGAAPEAGPVPPAE